MNNLDRISEQIRSMGISKDPIEIKPPREVRLNVSRDRLEEMAEQFRTVLNARPELILAEDHLKTRDCYLLRYIFEIDAADAFIIATVEVPEKDRTFPSLATQWFLASRFEREIQDLYGLIPINHPEPRRLPVSPILLSHLDSHHRTLVNPLGFPHSLGEG